MPTRADPSHHRALRLALVFCLVLAACTAPSSDDASLSRGTRATLRLGERVPDVPEREAVGPIARPITRGTREFSRLVRCDDPRIVFKDEEHTGADRLMTKRLRAHLGDLAGLVQETWPHVKLRVTEAWDEDGEHGPGSVHYEGRAADITTSDVDPQKLATLAFLATNAGFDWVFYENSAHVHVAVVR